MRKQLEFSNLEDLAQFKAQAACYELWFSSGAVYVGATKDLARRAYQHRQPVAEASSMGERFKRALYSGDTVCRCVVWLCATLSAANRHEERLLTAHLVRGSTLLNSTTDGKGCGELIDSVTASEVRRTNGLKGAAESLRRTTHEQRQAHATKAGQVGGAAKWGSKTKEQRAAMMRKVIDARLAAETQEKRQAKLEKMWAARSEKARLRRETERG